MLRGGAGCVRGASYAQDSQHGVLVRRAIGWGAADVVFWQFQRLDFQFHAQVFAGDTVQLFYLVMLGSAVVEADRARFDYWADHRLFRFVVQDAEASAVGGVDVDRGRGGM